MPHEEAQAASGLARGLCLHKDLATVLMVSTFSAQRRVGTSKPFVAASFGLQRVSAQTSAGLKRSSATSTSIACWTTLWRWDSRGRGGMNSAEPDSRGERWW